MLSISPVLGLVSGGLLAEQSGYLGVFSGLLVLALGLTVIASWRLPETRPAITTRVALWPLACRMARDGGLWRSALLVALFNAMLFGYYSLAPFLFAGLGLNASEFGYSGLVLALGTLIGSLLNKRLLGRGWQSMSLRLCVAGAGGGGCCVGESGFALVPVAHDGGCRGLWYRHSQCAQSGLADLSGGGRQCGCALFGLAYYLLLSLGLALAAGLQDLGMLLFGCGLLAVLCSGRRST